VLRGIELGNQKHPHWTNAVQVRKLFFLRSRAGAMLANAFPIGRDSAEEISNMKRRDVISLLAGAALQPVAQRIARATIAADTQRSPGEIRAGVMPTDYSFSYGDVRRYGMKVGAAPSENAAALQRCLNASAGAATVTIPGADAEYQLSGRITAPAGTSVSLGDGATLHWVATEVGGSTLLGGACRPALEVLGDDFRLTGKGRLVGPSAGVYVANEIGILCVGASVAAPRSRIVVADGVELSGWGSRAIAMQFANDLQVSGLTVTNCGYAGMQFLSCRRGRVYQNQVGEIGPGASGNAYGISCTHDSRNYASDPNAVENGRNAANPFCVDFDVALNTVYDIPVWVGVDFHGAYDCHARNNSVFNCRHGLTMQGSSGDATGFGGENNEVINNALTTRRMNGEPTTVTAVPRLGISLNGGAHVRHHAVTVHNNTIDGFGDTQHTSFALQHTYTSGVDISGNRVTDWRGYGCYSAYSDGIISGNDFGAVADSTGTACIFVAIGGQLQILGNRHVLSGGPAALYGLYINTPTDPPYVIQGNDFRSATLQQYAGRSGTRLSPAQIVGGRPA
jgi:hypothetical protein